MTEISSNHQVQGGTHAANISPICPPAFVSGALPNVPAKNLTMRIIGRFVDSAPAMLKIANNG